MRHNDTIVRENILVLRLNIVLQQTVTCGLRSNRMEEITQRGASNLLHQTFTNEEEKAGRSMSEEWRKFGLRNKISGGKYLREYFEELCMSGRAV